MRIQHTNAAKRGMTYVTVVVSALLVGLVLASYLKLVASQNQYTMRSQAWNRSVAVIEAGVEEALSHLNRNAAPDESSVINMANLASDGWTTVAGGGWTKSNSIGDDYYIVTIGDFTPPNKFPPIVAQGYVKQIPAFAALGKLSPWLAQITTQTRGDGYVRREVVCNTTNVPVFTKALVAKDTIDISGNNVFTDSFDSSDTTKSTNRRWDVTKRGDKGDIASNRWVTNTLSPLNIGNADIMGRVSTGPNTVTPGVGNIYVGSNGKVGSLAWHARGDTSGKIEPGWSRDDMNVEFPPVKLPFSGGMPPVKLNPSTLAKYSIDGVTYDMVFLTKGDYILGNNETLQGKIYVGADVRLVVPYGGKIALNGGSDQIVIASNACLKLFVDCPTASVGGQGIQNSGVATNFYYFGTEKNTSVAYGGNAQFTGVFYAPNAFLTMNGGGGAPIDFSGSGIFRAIKMNGNFSFHYDENLKRVGLYRGYTLTSWNET